VFKKEQTLAIWQKKEQQFKQQQEIETEVSINIQSHPPAWERVILSIIFLYGRRSFLTQHKEVIDSF
jgi:hypothetical protein